MKKTTTAKQCPRYWMSAPPVTIFRLTASTGERTLIVWHCAICHQWHAEFNAKGKMQNAKTAGDENKPDTQ